MVFVEQRAGVRGLQDRRARLYPLLKCASDSKADDAIGSRTAYSEHRTIILNNFEQIVPCFKH